MVLNLGIIFCLFLISLQSFSQGSQLALPPFTLIEEVATLAEPLTNGAVSSYLKNDVAYVYVFGGIDSTLKSAGIHRRCYRINVNDKNDVLRLPDMPDTLGKIALSASRIGSKAYIVGGYHVYSNGSEKSSKLVHEFDFIGDTFTSKKIILPIAIDDHVQGVWSDSLLFIINGWSNSSNVRQVQIYNPNKDTWSRGTPMDSTMTPTFGASGDIIENTIYVQGGARSDLNYFPATSYYFKGEIDELDPTKITWSGFANPDSNTSYRGALVSLVDWDFSYPYVIGGSKRSYNYDGIDYQNNNLVSPMKGIISLEKWQANSTSGRDIRNLNTEIPMDIRDWATMEINEFSRLPKTKLGGDSIYISKAMYLAGGISANGNVSNKIIRISLTSIVSISDVSSKKKISVFPIPFENSVTLSYPSTHSTVQLYSASGQIIKNIQKEGLDIQLDFRNLDSGVYYYVDQENQITKKLIKK